MRVLGIDPGTLQLGWGLIDFENPSACKVVDHDCLKAPAKKEFMARIGNLSEQVRRLLETAKPDIAVIEKIFLGKNVDSAFKLGHIRGVCVAECHRVGAQVFEYTPRVVKKQITGSGSADKMLVRSLLYRQLNLKENPKKSLDASDALALAFCHIMQDSVVSRIRKAEL